MIEKIPHPKRLQKSARSLAVCDIIMSPEWEYRYFSYDKNWAPNEEMASIRNGAGDDVFIVFQPSACFIKGFSHEYPNKFSNDDFYSSAPAILREATSEPAFTPSNVTFCFWQTANNTKWQSGVQPGKIDPGAFFLLQHFLFSAKDYIAFCKDYYELTPDYAAVESIFATEHLSDEIVKKINPDTNFSDIQNEVIETGYPIQL